MAFDAVYMQNSALDDTGGQKEIGTEKRLNSVPLRKLG